jgi:ketosteroid isomerase-like protein
MRLSGPIRSFAIALTFSVAIPMYAGPHRGARNLRDQIESLENQWKQAAVSNNIDAMDRLLSDDYLGITATGQVVTKPQQLDRMRTHSFAIDSIHVSDVKIKLISQHAAIVTSLAEVEGANDGRPLHGSFRYTRVYQRLPGTGGWKITNFEVTHVPSHLARADVPSQQ